MELKKDKLYSFADSFIPASSAINSSIPTPKATMDSVNGTMSL
jgi:hypothetical protein